MKERQNYIPFFHCNSSELCNINNSDDLEICKYLPSLEVVHQTSSFSKYNLPDVDDIPNLTTSKYHKISDFQNLNGLHTNVFELMVRTNGGVVPPPLIKVTISPTFHHFL